MEFTFPSFFTGKNIAIAGLLLSVLGLAYGWLKDRGNKNRELEKERAYKKAAELHGLAVRFLRILSPGYIRGTHGAYGTIIQDHDLRERVRIYLGNQNMNSGHFEPFQLSQGQINNPECCRTIEDVIKAVEAFKNNSPEDAQELKLPER